MTYTSADMHPRLGKIAKIVWSQCLLLIYETRC